MRAFNTFDARRGPKIGNSPFQLTVGGYEGNSKLQKEYAAGALFKDNAVNTLTI